MERKFLYKIYHAHPTSVLTVFSTYADVSGLVSQYFLILGKAITLLYRVFSNGVLSNAAG